MDSIYKCSSDCSFEEHCVYCYSKPVKEYDLGNPKPVLLCNSCYNALIETQLRLF